MPVEIIYKNKRQDADRRRSDPIDHDPERRSGLDRRRLDEKLKQLIEDNLKNQNKEQPLPASSNSGQIILRKKSEPENR